MKKTLVTLLLLAVVSLLGMGIIVVASASVTQGPTPYYYFQRQLKWVGAAILVGLLFSRFDYHLWKKYLVWEKYPLFSVGFYLLFAFLLVLTLCPGIAVEHKGSFRWLYLGGKQIFQPGEFAKLAIIVAVAVWLDHVGRRVHQFRRGVAVPAVIIGVYAVLLFLEKDLGAMMVVCLMGGALMFVAGTRIWQLAALAGCGILSIGGAVLTLFLVSPQSLEQMKENRLGRIWAWLEGSGSTADASYQIKQAILAIKSGGLWGVGFNQSLQKYWFLPEAHTDCIFAIGAEELGLCFSLGMLVAYAVLLVCGILIAIHAQDRLGRLLAFGMTLLLVFQAAFNIGVITGLLPPKGMALPFMSYGGSNLLTAMFAVGTLFNILLHMDVYDERMHTVVVRDAADTV